MQQVERRQKGVYDVHMAKKTPANDWPQRLKDVRDKFGLTQAQAAEKVRVSVRAWIKWEKGHQIPSPSHQLLLALLEQGKI